MAKTLTAANSVILLSVSGLFAVPQRLQGFSAENVFDTEQVESVETSMGVDGRFSGGWVPKEVKQTFTLQADSDSIRFFEDWHNAQQVAREAYTATGSVYLPSLERKYACRKGFLMGYSPMPSAAKIMQPRKFTIVWESVTSGGL